MALSDSPIVQNAAVVRAGATLVSRVRTAAASATTLQTVRRVIGTDHNRSGDGSQAASPQPESEEQQDQRSDSSQEAQNAERPGGGTEATTGSQGGIASSSRSGIRKTATQTSTVYRIGRRIKRLFASSWLYRWLTAEPDPDVIVIDLRKTRSAGPILQVLEQTITALLPAVATSGVTRTVNRTRRRLNARPIRVLSIGLIALLLTLLSVLVLSGDLNEVVVVGLIVLLILAVRGTQSTRSMEAIRQTWWFKTLVRAFEPPEPPGQAPSEDDDDEQ